MSLIQKSVLNLGGKVSQTVVNMVAGILLARSLGPEGMGQYQLGLTLVVFVAMFMNLGVGQASIFFINNQHESPEKTTATGLVFGLGVGLFSAIALFALLQIESYFGVLPLKTIVVLSIGTWVLSGYLSVMPVLMALLEIRRHVCVELARRLLVLVLLCPAILLSSLTVSSALTIQILGLVGSFILLMWFLRRYLKKWSNASFDLLKRMIRFGLQLSVGSIIYLLNVNIGLFMVRYFLADNFSHVGYYGRAVTIASLLLLLSGAAGPILYSKWSSLSLPERIKQVGLATRLMVAMGTAVSIVLMFSAKWVVLLMYGVEYLPAVLPLRILLVSVFLQFTFSPLLQLFPSSGQPLLTSVVFGVNLVVMVIAMPILIPRYSIAGAAGSVALANLAGLLVAYAIAVNKFGLSLKSCFSVKAADIAYVWHSIRGR